MLAAGDELGHTQNGNNNAYCQDNEIAWVDWDTADTALIAFTTRVLALRRHLLPLGTAWYAGVADAQGRTDLAWLRRTGEPMTAEHWNNRMSRIVGALIGRPGRSPVPLLLLLNGRDMDAGFELPPGRWEALLDTSQADGRSGWRSPVQVESGPRTAPGEHLPANARDGQVQRVTYPLKARSLVLMRDVSALADDSVAGGTTQAGAEPSTVPVTVTTGDEPASAPGHPAPSRPPPD
jgi:hypothetical protein